MLDEIDRKIVTTLAEDARISLKDLAGLVNMSSPSVSERLRRLEERGIIRSFTIDIDPRALGFELQAIIRVSPLPGKLHVVEQIIKEIPQFCECDKVTGEDCFFVRLYLRSIDELDPILEKIADKAQTNTSIVKSQPIRRRLPPLE